MTKHKKVTKTPKPCKRKVIKFRVKIIAQSRDFNEQDDAREWAKGLLDAKVYFMELIRTEKEEEGC